jgi:hypothetical protein
MWTAVPSHGLHAKKTACDVTLAISKSMHQRGVQYLGVSCNTQNKCIAGIAAAASAP